MGPTSLHNIKPYNNKRKASRKWSKEAELAKSLNEGREERSSQKRPKKRKKCGKKFVGGAAEAHRAAVYASARAELVHPHPLQRPGPRLHYHERPEDTGGQNSVKTNLIGRMFRPILGLLLRSSFLLLFLSIFHRF